MREVLAVGDSVKLVHRLARKPTVFNIDKIKPDGMINISNPLEFFTVTKYHLEKIDE